MSWKTGYHMKGNGFPVNFVIPASKGRSAKIFNRNNPPEILKYIGSVKPARKDSKTVRLKEKMVIAVIMDRESR